MSFTESETDQLACGILKIDKNRILLSGNRYALDLLLCETMDEITGLNIEEVVSLATRIFLNSYTFPMLVNEGKAEEVQLSFKSKTGEIVPVVANIQMNSDKTTDWTFMSCVNRNQLYNELLTARNTLQAQAQNLSQLNNQIHERQSDLQTFCHSLSHDFTGPLRRINQQIECAVEDLKENGVEAIDEFNLLEMAKNNTHTLMEITNGLVEYLVADVPTQLTDLVDLEEIVSTALEMLEQQGSMKPEVHRTSLPTIVGSRSQIQVLFKNLMENAIKYNKNYPVITISHTENVDNSEVIIAIKDNGIGMSNDYIDTVFTPFTRLHTIDQYAGSGLGLSIVKKMVMNHNGNIRVESTPGSGSTFFVSLPLRASSSMEKPK